MKNDSGVDLERSGLVLIKSQSAFCHRRERKRQGVSFKRPGLRKELIEIIDHARFHRGGKIRGDLNERKRFGGIHLTEKIVSVKRVRRKPRERQRKLGEQVVLSGRRSRVLFLEERGGDGSV